MALRYQNQSHVTGRTPSYYSNNKQYPGSYAQTDTVTRTSRRIHDGFSLTRNYGLDTTSDDINSSPYSSPFYINGRYASDNLTTQRASSSSVQGVERLADIHTEVRDFTEDDIETTLQMWQGKHIRFVLPYDGRVVGNTITLKNTEGSTGILSITASLTENGQPVYETAIDLCKISTDKFEHKELRSITTIPANASPRKKLYIRMEIFNEVVLPKDERNEFPFDTGKKIEIAATGKGNHEEYIRSLGEKNKPVTEDFEDYQTMPSMPLLGLVYNNHTSIPVDRLDNIKTGATVSLNGYRYDIMADKVDGHSEILIYDREMNRFIDNEIKLDGRAEQVYIAQVTDTDKVTWVYYVDGYSPLQRFKIGEWKSEAFPTGSADNITANIDEAKWQTSPLGDTSGTYVFTFDNGTWQYNNENVNLADYGITLTGGSPAEGSTITVIYTVTEGGAKSVDSIAFVDARPVLGASLIMFHNNRLYLTGFRHDPNLVQLSSIEAEGPNFETFPYRFYAPNRSPYDTSTNPITALTELSNDNLMISFKNGFSLYQTYGGSSSVGPESAMPVQISTFTDSAGVQSAGDITNYKGVLYSFDEKEGLRRFTGALWSLIPNSVDSHYDRVDMTKPRKLWGYSNKLYFNYTDKVDGIAKCLVWDMTMNYQTFPFFQDYNLPFCDIRFDESEELIGIHPDYPCVMKHYAENCWKRFDSPIIFRRDSKFLSMPGNASDMVVKRCHIKVLADTNRWWYVSLNPDRQSLTQTRGKDILFRQPTWDTNVEEEPAELPFSTEDVYEQNASYRLSLMNLRIQCSAVQVRVQTKTFRSQANLLSTELEVQPHQFL